MTMKEIDRSDLEKAIIEQLQEAKEIVLSTCADGKVTARTMCHINDGVTVLFATDDRSEKVAQMRKNPNIALTVGNLRIEAVAELFGRPGDHLTFAKAYAKKFPWLGEFYKPTPNDMLVICRPNKISLYKYDNGPQEDTWLAGEKEAFRADLSKYETESDE